MKPHSNRLPQRLEPSPRRGVTYLAVTGAATIVAMIALTASHLGRIALNEKTAARSHLVARALAVSAAECCISRIKSDFNWRNSLTSGTRVTVPLSGAGGTSVFMVTDPLDGDLKNDPSQPVLVEGFGRSGDSSARIRVELSQRTDPATTMGPIVVRAYTTSNGSSSQFDVTPTQSIGQYFVPQLPAEAVSWTVSGVDLFLERKNPVEGLLTVSLCSADATRKPAATLQTAAVAESTMPQEGQADWIAVSFPTPVTLLPGEGVCITLSRPTAGAAVAVVHYDGAGVSEPDSFMLTGANGAWPASEADKSLLFRVRGAYSTAATATGEFEVLPGSWQEVSN